MTKKIKLAVVGATGLVGKTVLKVLEEKNLPIDKYTFLASARSKGKQIFFNGKKYKVQELTKKSFDKDYDFAIFAAGSETSKVFAKI